jgi:hypothetical protein
MDSTLSVEVDHDFLPDFNRMLPLPDVGDCDDVDLRIGRGARLRLWRGGPAEPHELRPAVEAEVEEAIEHGELSRADAADRIERVCVILASDTSLADPPDVDEVAAILERGRERFAQFYHPPIEGRDGNNPLPDRYGNWPGVNWRTAVEYGLSKAFEGEGTKGSTSKRLAMLWLRREKIEHASAVAEQEKAARKEAVAIAHGRLAIVFEDERQELLKLVIGFWAYGDLEVRTSGTPIVEAKLLAELLNLDPLGLPEAAVSDVVEELIRFAVAWPTSAGIVQTVPTVGYAIEVEGREIVDVFPGHMRLTIEGGDHVLQAPQLPRPVRMSAKVFRDPRLCAQAIYDQTLVEVDLPRGHWRKWWPVLAARLGKTARVVEDAQRVREWQQFVAGIMATAPESPYAFSDGRPYWHPDGYLYLAKDWLKEHAVARGVIGSDGRRAFSDWVSEISEANKPRRDAENIKHKLIRIGKNGPLCIEGSCEPVEKNEVDGSGDVNEP